jgi:hypothetical protein
MSTRTVERAVSAAHTRTTQTTPYVRTLLARGGHYVVPTQVLAAYLGNLVVREQFKHHTVETVQWALAMFDARCVSGATAPRHTTKIGCDISQYIDTRIGKVAHIELKFAIEAVLYTLVRVFGKQLTVTGWVPGIRIADAGDVLELSGDACPSCVVNPTVYKAGSTSKNTRCLNSEDCGWTNS